MAKKTFKVGFPVRGYGYDKITIDEKLLEGKTDKEVREILYDRIGAPCLCHQCAHDVEEVEVDVLDVENDIKFWEDDE